jgi:hypothetical protein
MRRENKKRRGREKPLETIKKNSHAKERAHREASDEMQNATKKTWGP